MTGLGDIVSKIRSYAPDTDLRPLMDAYELSVRTHQGQFRKDGSAYVEHPIAVAAILADLHMDVETIATALLHDALEDNPQTKLEMEAQMGPVITDLVDGVTKIGKLRFRSKQDLQAENFRKMMLAMSKDLRVILVKLADRLHNMRTLAWHSPQKRIEIATETEEVYAPIANRLGLTAMKSELEDLCLKYLHPEAYERITRWLDETAADRSAYIERVSKGLQDLMTEHGVGGRVSGRAKAPSSIYRKMEHGSLDVGEVQDLLAFRMIVDNLSDCYAMLGWIHAKFEPIPGRIKDYIARPKPNGYRSLHTTVVGPENRLVEIQVRTEDMHKIAEQGIAAHWQYKEGHLALAPGDVLEISKIRDIFEAAKDTLDASDFMEALKVAFYADEVFVLTPQGEVKRFPVGATPVDFAFAVHSDIGEHCQGARVNGTIVPLDYKLQSADVVEIITDPRQRPRRGWLNFVKTSRAISKIRRSLRLEEEDAAVEMGRSILTDELQRLGWTLSRASSEGRLPAYLARRNLKVLDPVLGELARGTLTASDVAKAILPEGTWVSRQEDASRGRLTKLLERIVVKRSRSPVLITGEDDLLVNYAGCCSPLPGEQVVGFVTRGRGITVHREDCPTLANLEPARLVEVRWDTQGQQRHSSTLIIYCEDRAGVLAALTRVCEDLGVNIEKIDAQSEFKRMGTVRLQVAVRDLIELTKVIRGLENVPGVSSVKRAG